MAAEADKLAELQRAISEIRDRVGARYPSGWAPLNVPLADLMPLVHARDAAEAKVAAIGTVNPRPPGLLNNIAQAWKRFLARLLDWHVREQVEFNRGTMNCINAAIESMNEMNHAVQELAARTAAEQGATRESFERRLDDLENNLSGLVEPLRQEAQELADVRLHWQEWRKEWERKLSINEVQFLRGLADLQAAFNHRATLMEGNFRDITKSQHNDFEGALNRSSIGVQQRLWQDLERIRLDYERLIHSELRQIRQRAFLAPQAVVVPGAPLAEDYDVLQFAGRFRGSEERIRTNLGVYVPYFAGSGNVLDIGCGRGEFLEKMREAGVAARGIDLHEESVALCRSKGLNAEVADMYAFLESQPDCSFDGIFCSQVVEHLRPAELPRLIHLLARKMVRGAVLAIETPNPECLAIFASHFYLDPTHVRPVPPQLACFYLEESGFGQIEVVPLSPAIESMPSLSELPEGFRNQFFGSLDYAAIARKL